MWVLASSWYKPKSSVSLPMIILVNCWWGGEKPPTSLSFTRCPSESIPWETLGTSRIQQLPCQKGPMGKRTVQGGAPVRERVQLVNILASTISRLGWLGGYIYSCWDYNKPTYNWRGTTLYSIWILVLHKLWCIVAGVIYDWLPSSCVAWVAKFTLWLLNSLLCHVFLTILPLYVRNCQNLPE